MSSITRRRRSKGSETRAAVEEAIVAALERLSAKGRNFTSVSVEELAQEAGIARSTFYMHFQDKGELVRRLMKHVAQELMAASAVWFESEDITDKRSLRTSISRIAGVYEKHRAIMLAIAETAAYDADVAEARRETMDQLCSGTRAILKRAQLQGHADTKLAPETADALTWMVERCCHQLLGNKKPAQRERIIDAMTHIAWSSIFTAPA